MKTFRMIGMALLAFLLSVNWVSCSGGDEPDSNEDSPIEKEKKLLRVLMETEYMAHDTRMIYNDEGRLMTTLVMYGTLSQTSNWFWTENNVSNNQSAGVDFSLENGLIKKFRDYGDLVYNASNQFVKINEACCYGKRDLTWKDGAVIKQIIDYSHVSSSEMNYSYKKTCKGYFPLFFLISLKYDFDDYAHGLMMSWEDDENALLYAHPELVGLRINQLPDEVIMQGSAYHDCKYSFAYSFTSDGYVEKCTVGITTSTGNPNSMAFTFEWE